MSATSESVIRNVKYALGKTLKWLGTSSFQQNTKLWFLSIERFKIVEKLNLDFGGKY